MTRLFALAGAATLLALPATAQDIPDPFVTAAEIGACGDAPIAEAYWQDYNANPRELAVACETEDDATAFTPLLGGLGAGGAAIAAGGIALVAAAGAGGDSDSSSDTQ